MENRFDGRLTALDGRLADMRETHVTEDDLNDAVAREVNAQIVRIEASAKN